MSARTCVGCGKALSSNSPHVSQCGRCARKRLDAARADTWTYRRTHVHTASDGRLTIELGVECVCGDSP